MLWWQPIVLPTTAADAWGEPGNGQLSMLPTGPSELPGSPAMPTWAQRHGIMSPSRSAELPPTLGNPCSPAGALSGTVSTMDALTQLGTVLQEYFDAQFESSEQAAQQKAALDELADAEQRMYQYEHDMYKKSAALVGELLK